MQYRSAHFDAKRSLLRCGLPLIVLGLTSVAFAQEAAQPEMAAPLTVIIDPGVKHGVWEGWGTSLAWMGKVFGDRDDVADLLFTTQSVKVLGGEVPGLGMNIARYNLGACSWNEVDGRRMVVSKAMAPYRQIEGFWLDGKDNDPKSASWNWEVDGKQRALLLKAKQRGADHFELFSNSPMWWMTGNDNPSGAEKGRDDNLPARNYPAFATYLATVARQAKERWGVAFTSVEPFNEPTSGYWSAAGRQEGAQFNAPAQIAFLPLLRSELDRQGLGDLPISASDETHTDHAVNVWKQYPAAVKDIVAQVNVHGYQMAKGNRAELYQLAVTESGKKLWNSEYGDGASDGLEMARNINHDLHALHPTAWCYWQPLDGGNKGGWGMIDADLGNGVLRGVNPKYFVLAQYSRHLREGMTVLDSSDGNTVSAYDAARHKLVIITLNDGPARSIRYDLAAFGAPDGPVISVMTEPRGLTHYQVSHDFTVRQKSLTVEFPANSIQSFEIEGVTSPGT